MVNIWGPSNSRNTGANVINGNALDSGNYVGTQIPNASGAASPWGSLSFGPGVGHVPQYAPIHSLNFDGMSGGLQSIATLFHPTAPTSAPMTGDVLRGQTLVANATDRIRGFFAPITQVFHSPQIDNTPRGNP